MNATTMTSYTMEELPGTRQQALPEASFPNKYVHSVLDDQQDALQASLTLIAAGYNAEDIHILTYESYVEATERKHSIGDFVSSKDVDDYLREARRGACILAVRVSGHEQAEQVRKLLAPHGARIMKHIDTWTVTPLLP
jgi:hypothetical protein